MICCDLHVHPDYSVDAKSSIEEYCLQARQIDLQVLGFSTHYDANPARKAVDPFMVIKGERVALDDEAVAIYVDHCLIAREIYSDIKILIGLEIDYFPGVEEEVVRLRDRFPFDYMIGSVHCLDDIAFTSRNEEAEYFRNHGLEEMADNYFKLLGQVAGCGLFDIIGHADYYLRFGLAHFGVPILGIFKERLSDVVKAAVRTGTGFEVNTSGLNHDTKSFYPSLEFLKQATALGAKINSIGSDSHTHETLGRDINKTLVTLKKNDIRIEPFYESR